VNINIIPTPKRTISENEFVSFPSRIITNYEAWQPLVKVFAESFEKISEGSVVQGEGGVELIFDNSIREGGYILKVKDGIKLYASDYDGAAYSIATVLALVETNNENMKCPFVEIEDYPDKKYRALMVDVARQWHPAVTIYKYIDICFLYKIKYFHIHFIDDQSYTLPSQSFPKISTNGKSYTRDEIQGFNDYARDRGIIIVPEFETPGHAKSLNMAYPDVFSNHISPDTIGSMITENGELLSADSLICAGKESAMCAIYTLLQEICEMFPNSPFIHIGGDEADIKLWNECSVCREYMKQKNIGDEYELYSEFIARVAKLVLQLGKTPIVWEGFPKQGEKMIPRETIVMAWESHYHMPYDLIDEGFKIINCSWQPLYIVNSLEQRWNPLDIMRWNVYNWQHWWSESEAYLNPVNIAPTENVLGAQLCAWESTYEQEINFIMENLAALSERTWNVKRVCCDDEFKTKHKKLMQIVARLITSK